MIVLKQEPDVCSNGKINFWTHFQICLVFHLACFLVGFQDLTY